MPNSRCSQLSNPCLVGDPVDTSKGSAVDETIDFRLIGPLEFRWTRYYDSSMSHQQFGVGWGHSHAYELQLRMDFDGFSYQLPLGRVIGFPSIEKDGAKAAAFGYLLERVSLLSYRVHHYAEPSVEFEFVQFGQAARPKRVFRADKQILFEYDRYGRWTRIVDSKKRSIRVHETPDRRIEGLFLEGHRDLRLISYEYDRSGNLIHTTDSSGHGFECAYDARNRMVRRTGRKGFSFRFSYDLNGRCIQSVGDGRMHEVSLRYEDSGRVTKVTQDDGGLRTYFFDASGRLQRLVDALGGTQTFVYEPSGRLESEIDANGNVTTLVYNAAGAAVAKITPLGRRIPLPEDRNSPDPRVERIAGNAAEYEFGRQLRVDDIVLPDVREVAALPIATEAARFIVARPSTGSALQPGDSFEPPPLGRRWWPKPDAGRHFSDLGKLVQQRDQWGRVRSWDYDASGNLSRYRDFDGAEWLFDSATWHLRKAETNPLGATVRFTHTTSGRIGSFTDAGGTVSEYSYDLNDRLTHVTRHGTLRDKYTFDAAGNLIAKHTADDRPLLQLEIGPGNLPLKRTLASGDEHSLEYDEAGRVLLAATRKDRIEFRYDDFGNRCADLKNGCGIEQYFERAHLPSESLFFGRFRIGYDYQSDGATIITDPGGAKHQIRFHGSGIVERRFSNSSRETAQYDNLGRCLFKCARRADGKVWSRVFEWSGEGELSAIKDSQYGENRHEYDQAHRLRGRIFPGGKAEQYAVDAAGNLLSQPGLDGVRMQPGNRLATANGETFEYNDRNHVSVRRAEDDGIEYEYDSRDFLTRATIRNAVWGAEYDPFGRRTRKIFAGRTTEFFWNTDQLVAEQNHDGRVRIYVYPDAICLTPLMFIEYDSVEAAPETCRRFFVFSDQIGTPCRIEGESGSVVWSARIDPYGFAQIPANASIEFNLRFPGHYSDGETGLFYNRFRYYDPRLGRYLQSDPWGIAGGYNLYAYCHNPLLQVDVRGLGEEDDPECNPHADDEEDVQQWEATVLAPDEEPQGFPPPTDESNAAAAAVVAALNDPNNGLNAGQRGRMVVALSTDQGFPIVGISGRQAEVQPIIDCIGPQLEAQGITVAPAAVDTSTLSQPGTRRDGSTFPGTDNTCGEPKAWTQAGQMGATPTGQTALWGNPSGKQPTGVTQNPDGTYPPCGTVCKPNEQNITALGNRN